MALGAGAEEGGEEEAAGADLQWQNLWRRQQRRRRDDSKRMGTTRHNIIDEQVANLMNVMDGKFKALNSNAENETAGRGCGGGEVSRIAGNSKAGRNGEGQRGRDSEGVGVYTNGETTAESSGWKRRPLAARVAAWASSVLRKRGGKKRKSKKHNKKSKKQKKSRFKRFPHKKSTRKTR